MSASTTPVLSAEQLATGLSYSAYRQHIAEVLADPSPTEQVAKMLPYYQQAVDHMDQIAPTVALLPELQAALGQLSGHYIWAIITEGWCGDASHTVPIIEAVAQASTRATSCATRTPTSSTATSPMVAEPSPSPWCCTPTRSPKPACGGRAPHRSKPFTKS